MEHIHVVVEGDGAEIIGALPDGTTIYAMSGATNQDVTDWIPIEYSDEVVQRVYAESAIERYADRVPMASKSKSIPRSAGLVVSVGTTYVSDTSANDEVTITARRFIARITIDEDDLADAETRMDVLGAKGLEWAISYADTFDHACIGVSAAENGTDRPFKSIHWTIRNNDTDVSYTGDTNYLTWDDDLTAISATPAGTSLYEKLSALFKKVEITKYWNAADMIVLAHPGWRDALRVCTDAQGRPIFVAGGNGTPDTLFGTPIAWTRGARVHPTVSGSPSGNDLLVYVNRRYLKRGDRSGPETLTDDARAQDDTDDYAVKFRTRRGFRLTHPLAAAVLERLTD